MNPKLRIAIDTATKAKKFLLKSGKNPLILVEGNRNQGDVLHHTVILNHYRTVHKDACIVFLVGSDYHNAHEFNPHADRVIPVPVMEPKERIAFRRWLLEEFEPKIKVIAPSIHPYREVWKELNWILPNIADQYLANAGIKELACPKKLIVEITPDDKTWADNFLLKYRLKPKRVFGFEYKSYSKRPVWSVDHYMKFVKRLQARNISCVCFCGEKEKPIFGSISGAGISWRRTVAILSKIPIFIGCGSGVTMLAAAAIPQPKIVEVAISDSVSMKGCGYADSIRLKELDPLMAADYLYYQVYSQAD